MIYILNVIEWADEEEESMDEVLANNMKEEGRRMLGSIVIPRSAKAYERMVKIGDPTTKNSKNVRKVECCYVSYGSNRT